MFHKLLIVPRNGLNGSRAGNELSFAHRARCSPITRDHVRFGDVGTPPPYTPTRILKELHDSTPEYPRGSVSSSEILSFSITGSPDHQINRSCDTLPPPPVIPDWRALARGASQIIPDWRGFGIPRLDWRRFAQISVIRVNQW